MKRILLLATLSLLLSCQSPYGDLEPGIYAELQSNRGTVLLQLEMEKTPMTVANFVALSEGNHPYVSEEFKDRPFYDGILFHRVIEDFMIQGGDPSATGMGGPGFRFDDEFTDLTHSGPGILSMANSGPGTNGSQFFITHKETPWLDGKHTVFGKVIDGQEVVDSIQQNDTIQKMNILRIGKMAQDFDAPQTFSETFKSFAEIKAQKEKRRAEISAESRAKFDALKEKAKTTASGLQYIITEKGNGPKVTQTYRASTHYAVYFANGELLETSKLETAEALEAVNETRKSLGQYVPIPADCSTDAQMIEGFKEGLRLLRVGDKAVLFVPYQLAYGEYDSRGIPGKSDLIFEVEIVELLD